MNCLGCRFRVIAIVVAALLALDARPGRGQPPPAVLVDIALLPEHRGKGIGGGLVRQLIQQCDQEKLPLRLQVLRTNPALRLYERLGWHRLKMDRSGIERTARRRAWPGRCLDPAAPEASTGPTNRSCRSRSSSR